MQLLYVFVCGYQYKLLFPVAFHKFPASAACVLVYFPTLYALNDDLDLEIESFAAIINLDGVSAKLNLYGCSPYKTTNSNILCSDYLISF